MKIKQLLLTSIGLAFFGNNIHAQKNPASANGFFATEGYAKDDFSSKNEFSNIVWRKDSLNGSHVIIDSISRGDGITCVKKRDVFSFRAKAKNGFPSKIGGLDSSFTRNGDGKQTFIITQPYGQYWPIGFDFGNTKKSTKAVLDLSNNNAVVYFSIKNNSSYDLQLRVVLYDSLGKTVNSNGYGGANYPNSVWKDELSWSILAGETLTDSANFNVLTAYQGLFAMNKCGQGTSNGGDNTLNFKAIHGVSFIISNVSTTGSFGGEYKPYQLKNAEIAFTYLQIGNKSLNQTLPVDFNKGLIVNYPFDGNANDVSGYNNHAIANNTTLTSDRFGNTGKAFLFNGATSYVDAPYQIFDHASDSAYTVLCWFKTFSTSDVGNKKMTPLYSKTTKADQDPLFGFSFVNDKNLYVQGFYTENSDQATLSFLPSAAIWHSLAHIVTKKEAFIYFDGKLAAYHKQDIAWGEVLYNVPNAPKMNLQIGSEPYLDTEYLDGAMDDFRIYNRALNQTEIYNHYKDKLSAVITSYDEKLENKDSKILISPNPASNYVNIHLEGEGNVRIMSIEGLLIGNYKLISNSLSIGHLPKGTYVFEISQNQTIQRQKVIIQ